MARDDWLPAREDELAAWYRNFAAKLPEFQTRLDLFPGDLMTVAEDAALLQAVLRNVLLTKQAQREWVEFKNLQLYGRPGDEAPTMPARPELEAARPVPPGIVSRTRALVGRIKDHAGYNDSVGDVLGLLGGEPDDQGEVKPAGEAKVVGGFQVEISFVKSRYDGVDIEGKRRRATRWTHMAFDGYSPYIDNRPPLVVAEPEQRHYRLRYRDNDVPVGLYSDVLSVTARP